MEPTNGFHFLSFGLSKIKLEVATSPDGNNISEPPLLIKLIALFLLLIFYFISSIISENLIGIRYFSIRSICVISSFIKIL
jgi:hypothetical protein